MSARRRPPRSNGSPVKRQSDRSTNLWQTISAMCCGSRRSTQTLRTRSSAELWNLSVPMLPTRKSRPSSPRRSILTTTGCSAARCMPWVGARTRAGCRRSWLQLESEDPEIRFEAARAAGLLGSTDALPVLLQAARDDDAEVRHVAISAIGQIGGRGAVRALERLAEDAGEADLELIQSAIDDVNTLLEPLQPSSS